MKIRIALAIGLLASCSLVPGALGDPVPARWALAAPAGVADTQLSLTVYEVPCSSGAPIEGRTEEPRVEMGATTVTVTIRIRQRLGTQTCPLHPWPLTVLLPEPLGNRQLLDGGRVPPAPPEGL